MDSSLTGKGFFGWADNYLSLIAVWSCLLVGLVGGMCMNVFMHAGVRATKGDTVKHTACRALSCIFNTSSGHNTRSRTRGTVHI